MGFDTTAALGAITLDAVRRAERIGTPDFADLALADRAMRAARGQLLTAQRRDESAVGTTRSLRPYADVQSGAGPYYLNAAAIGLVFTAPTPLPGSANETTSSGTLIADRGGLHVRARLYLAELVVLIFPITIAGSYGQTTTVGTPTQVTLTSTTTPGWEWVAADALFPVGLASGDDYRLDVLWRPIVEDEIGYLAGWTVNEAPITTVAP